MCIRDRYLASSRAIASWAKKKQKSSGKRPSAERHAHTFAAVMLLHINWNAAHEIAHPAATPKVFQYGYVIGQFTDGIIGHLNVHHLAVFTTKLLYLFELWCPGEDSNFHGLMATGT